MRLLLVLLLAVSPVLSAQMQMPAGTTSPLALAEQQKQLEQAEDLLRSNHLAEAREELLKIVHDSPKDARAQYDLGYAEEALQHTAEAETAYRAAIAADAKQFESRLALALLLGRKGDLAAAREQLAIAVTLTPLTGGDAVKAEAYRALAQIDAGKQNADAAQELAQAIKLSAETAEDRQLAARIASASGDATDAETAYRSLLKSSPGDAEASSGLARLLMQQNKLPEAEAVLKTAADAHPDDLSLTAQLASVYGAQGKAEAALPLLEKASAAHPNEPALTRMLARLYVQTGQPQKAAPLYEALLQKTPKDVALMDDYGNCLIRLQRPADAQKVLQAAMADTSAFADKDLLAQTAAHLAFAASANHDADTVLRALAVRDGILAPSASSLFLAATAHDRLHHTKLAMDLYRQFLKAADGKYPNEEWEARHRLIALEHAK